MTTLRSLSLSLFTSLPPQVNWVMFVQESVHDSVVARLKNRMEMMPCMALRSGQEKALVETVVLEAEQQGVMVSPENAAKIDVCSHMSHIKLITRI